MIVGTEIFHTFEAVLRRRLKTVEKGLLGIEK